MPDPQPERDPLEVLAAEYTDRLRRGERPAVADYAARHPELAEEIRELFPTIAVTERLKARQSRSSDGRATLGPARLERLGDFRLIREIGRGGMGVVFEAEQESLGRRVAVKVLPRQVLLDEKHLKRFEREARIAANLHHTNIVEVFGAGAQDGFHYYVMQYIEGVGVDAVVPLLAEIAAGRGGLASEPAAEAVVPAPAVNPLARAAVHHLLGDAGVASANLGPDYWRHVARIGLQAADALQYAHSRGVLHRDIKPANLLLGGQGTLWLADFGLAKAAQSTELSLSHDIVGTLRYMPPEQLQGQTDCRSDLYSLGLTLYELLALRPAYAEADQSRLIQRIVQGPPPPAPSALHPEVPRDLETIILKSIHHDAAGRYAAAAELADDLRCFLEDRPIRARRVSSVERLGRWCRRNKRLAALSGTSLVLLVMVAGVASIGYVRTNRARAQAEANANLAIEVLDRMFERFSPTRVRLQPQLALPGAGTQPVEAPVSPILSKEAAALLEGMLPFYDRLARPTGNDDRMRARTADANQRVGAIRQRLGQFDEAVTAYRRALALNEQRRAGAPADPNLKLEAARIENELGRIHTSRRQLAEAREAHRAALALLQADAGLPTASAAMRFELARTDYLLGTQERPMPAADPRREGRPAPVSDEQRDRLAQAVGLLKRLVTSAPSNPDYQHLLALCYLEGAVVEEAGGSEPRGGAERAIEILESLVQGFPAIPDYAYDLSEAYARIRIPRPPVPPEAQRRIEDRFGRALALIEALAARQPDVPDFAAALARMHDRLGSFHRQLERWAEAEKNFRKAIAVQAPLVNQFPDAPYYGLWMATFRIALADTLIRRNQPGEARAELEDALATLLRQLERTPTLVRPHDLLALGYANLEIVLRQAGENDRADEAARQAEQERTAARRAGNRNGDRLDF